MLTKVQSQVPADDKRFKVIWRVAVLDIQVAIRYKLEFNPFYRETSRQNSS